MCDRFVWGCLGQRDGGYLGQNRTTQGEESVMPENKISTPVQLRYRLSTILIDKQTT